MRRRARVVSLIAALFLGSGAARGQCQYCPLCPPPYATATASEQTICAGHSTQLTGGGGYPCSWWPTGGLANPSSCNTAASPSQTTSYTVTVFNAWWHCNVTAAVTISVTRSPAPTIRAPTLASPGQAGLTASVPLHQGSTYEWEIFNGTITSGQGTNAIIFTAGPRPVTVGGVEVGVTLSVIEIEGDCESEKASASVSLDGSGQPPRRKPRSVPFR